MTYCKKNNASTKVLPPSSGQKSSNSYFYHFPKQLADSTFTIKWLVPGKVS